MKRQLRMTAFHVRQFVSVPYFIQLMVMTTTATTLVQFLAASAWGGITPMQGWVRGGVVGMWTTTTCAAGIIGFERYKGTLVHLILAPVGALRSLAAVVCAAASFGLAAFPVAWCTWALLSASVSFTGPGWEVCARLVVGALMLLVGCVALLALLGLGVIKTGMVERGAVRAHSQRDPVRGAAAGAGVRCLGHRVHLGGAARLAGRGESIPAAVGALRATARSSDERGCPGRLAGVHRRVARGLLLPGATSAAAGDAGRDPGGSMMRAQALAFVHRFASGVRVSWASSTAFATLGTAVVTLLVLPLLDVLFDVLMGSDLSAPDLVRTGYAAVLVALSVSVASGVVSTVATDRMLGVFQEVHTRRRLDVAYWLAVAVVPALLAALTAVVAIGAVFTLSPQHDPAMLGRVIVLAAPAIVCGLLMGIAAAGVGVSLPDPYLGTTIIATFLPLLTGVIVPLEQCPAWLQALARVVPVSGTLTVLDAPVDAVPVLLGRDLAVAAAWAGIGLAVTRRAITRLRQGQRTDTI